ncbi:MAG: hypothetical protein Q9225_000678 [Loekoesia sp. 1 TL-2023]
MNNSWNGQRGLLFTSRIEGDCAIVRYKGQTIGLTAPLRAKGRTSTRAGEVDHDTIIGKQPRDVVVSSKDRELRVQVPTLEEHIVMTPRLVTPIYPADANLIVSLLDLHPDASQSGLYNNSHIEILEAGTGHGSLTLHLARAIHAANAGWDMPRTDDAQTVTKKSRLRHRAVVHTIDISSKYSEHAAKIIGGFRRGIYTRDIEFHVGDVSEWIDRQIDARDQRAFLSHIILDLPMSHTHIEKALSALQVDGKLILFNPSITQINSAIELVKTLRLPLQLERVVEVGPAMTGGRIWDVRLVRPRALTREANVKSISDTDTDNSRPASNALDDEASFDDDGGRYLVCKPKIGDRISGGGFVALWSRNRTRKDIQ